LRPVGRRQILIPGKLSKRQVGRWIFGALSL
jgi:hypothetical protein